MKRYYLFISGLVVLFIAIYLLTAFGMQHEALQMGYYRMSAYEIGEEAQPITPESEYFLVEKENEATFTGKLIAGVYRFEIRGNVIVFTNEKLSYSGKIENQTIKIQFLQENIAYVVTYLFAKS